MRDEFRARLDEISRTLVIMSEGVQKAMNRATAALLTADLEAAQRVIARDAEIDATYRVVEDQVYEVLARQAPVASDLRLVVTSLHVAADLERMGDLADHVARTARRRHPASAVAPGMGDVFNEMGEVADRISGKIGQAISERDAATAAQLDRDDDVMDDLHRSLFTVMFGPDWNAGVEAAVDTALLGRYYERYADHAVNVGRHVVFLVTGETLAAKAF
jgi:phosphate transport system protein